MKGISLKKGSRNSVHVDGISFFTDFLKGSGVPENIINDYRKYHFADGTLNGKGSKRQSAEEYKKDHQEEINNINSYLNTEDMIRKACERFVLKGTNSDYTINALIYGEVNDFMWLEKEEIIDFMVSRGKIYNTGVHFGPLTVQPKTRCLNYNSKYERDRYCVQVKWYSLFEDILRIKTKI